MNEDPYLYIIILWKSLSFDIQKYLGNLSADKIWNLIIFPWKSLKTWNYIILTSTKRLMDLNKRKWENISSYISCIQTIKYICFIIIFYIESIMSHSLLDTVESVSDMFFHNVADSPNINSTVVVTARMLHITRGFINFLTNYKPKQ